MIEIFITIFLLFFAAFGIILSRRNSSSRSKNACIIVLGDIGRSPRMNYHCLSLLESGYSVNFIGYTESNIMEEMKDERIKVLSLKPYPKFLQIGPSLLQYVFKTVFLTLTLLIKLFQMKIVPQFVLVQNPPSIPTLGLAYLYCKLFKSKFIIDWHNYGYTILAIKSGYENPLVKICKRFEIFFGQRSDLNFCVTKAMSEDLKKFSITAKVMYDKPHRRFKKLTTEEKKQFYDKLRNNYAIKIPVAKNNLALLVSSSSWTEDEDFHILINALKIYDQKTESSGIKLPEIILLLTGKGPLKEYYQKKFSEQNYKNIEVNFVWLEQNDYPLLLGSCDLGICLHMSSSNLDLPMKVVDMFGARLPVCAYSFACISELVKEEENGMLFSNEEQLANQLIQLLQDFDSNKKLETLRKNLVNYPNWDQEWTQKIRPEINLFQN